MNLVDRVKSYVTRFYRKIEEAHGEAMGDDAVVEVIAEYGTSSQYPGTIFVSVMEIERAYGGPEEGGWWYDIEGPVETVLVDLRWRAASPGPDVFVLGHDQESLLIDLESIWEKRYLISANSKRGNVNGGPDHRIDISFTRQKVTPSEKPTWG